MLKKLVNKLIEECTENDEEAKITGLTLFEHKKSADLFAQFMLS